MADTIVSRANAFLRSHPRARAAQKRLTRPARRHALPILVGAGRGLRVRFDDSALTRAVSRAEAPVEEVFLSLLAPGAVVFDVGANIGWYSLLAARAVGPTGTVIAFEPSVRNAALVQANAATNGLLNVKTIPAAVTDEDGWATFLDNGSLEGRLSKHYSEAQAKRRESHQREPRGSFVVPVLSLDSWIPHSGVGSPSVVKIDVEGAEVGVIRGMTETLRSSGPTLIIELHGTQSEVADALDAVGYEHAPINSEASTREGPGWAHILARPPRAATDARP
ncbi:MAG TPA: FkbM family methyltransferase [Solirubrobacteraceae bacterium]|jgi:FkbM family methyltransferase|nr:FkbM family methyltransferase [Solirubrobacteraceae bacterium]